MIINSKYPRKRQGRLLRSLPLLIVGLLAILPWGWEKEQKATPIIYNTENDLLVLMQAENGSYTTTQVSGDTVATDTEEELFPELHTEAATVVEVPAEEKICYLTFDDGPSVNTKKVLEILAEYDAKATFFVVGTQIHAGTEDTLRQLLNQGHAVGIHAYAHEYKSLYKSQNAFLRDYERVAKLLREKFQTEATFFRFPGGSTCAYLGDSGKKLIAEMHNRGYRCFDWNVSGEDSVGEPTVESILQNVYRDVFRYNHPVILLHDSGGAVATVEALPKILQRLKEEGYRFETLEGVEEYVFPKSRP